MARERLSCRPEEDGTIAGLTGEKRYEDFITKRVDDDHSSSRDNPH
jgi:hypothetical protein